MKHKLYNYYIIEELDKRLKSYAEDPDDLLDWQEVKKDW